jgi:hypothetical protein
MCLVPYQMIRMAIEMAREAVSFFPHAAWGVGGLAHDFSKDAIEAI